MQKIDDGHVTASIGVLPAIDEALDQPSPSYCDALPSLSTAIHIVAPEHDTLVMCPMRLIGAGVDQREQLNSVTVLLVPVAAAQKNSEEHDTVVSGTVETFVRVPQWPLLQMAALPSASTAMQ